MVESIFGGKSAYPCSGNERNIFHPRLADRRLSVPTTHLKTISETGDDTMSLSTSKSTEEENTELDGPTCYRRPRTMSLPAIYRDGSYLRIRRPSNTLSPSKRRYSEPGAITTQHIIHRLSLGSSDSNESENNFEKRPSVKSMETPYSIRESGFSDFAPRRHSDPMHYLTENMGKLGISQGRQGKLISKSVTCPTVKTLSGTIKARQPQNDNEQTAQTAVVRRRKSSLVPVPFSSVQQHSKACNTQLVSSGRPRSFPPSKQDGKRQCNLPELKTAFLTGNVADRPKPTDWNNNKDLTLESEESKEDKYVANTDMLVQWMKFFG